MVTILAAILTIALILVAVLFGGLIPQGLPPEAYLDRFGESLGQIFLFFGLDDIYRTKGFLLLGVLLFGQLLVCTGKRIALLQAQLKSPSLAADEEHQIQKALAEYVEAESRSRRLTVRRNALEATLLSLPDKLEEVYQLVMAAPFSTEMGSKIEESLSRLRIAEEVSAEFDSGDLFNLGSPVDVSSAKVASRKLVQCAEKKKKKI